MEPFGGAFMTHKGILEGKYRNDVRQLSVPKKAKKNKKVKVWEWREYKPGEIYREIVSKPAVGKFYRSPKEDFIYFHELIVEDPSKIDKKRLNSIYKSENPDHVEYVRSIGNVMNRFGSYWNKKATKLMEKEGLSAQKIFPGLFWPWFKKNYKWIY